LTNVNRLVNVAAARDQIICQQKIFMKRYFCELT
jgi:hypothetical protein